MHVLSHALDLPAGLPLSGFAGARPGRLGDVALEVNAWRFDDAATGRRHELCALDALYAGDLVGAAGPIDGTRIIAASHTHYAPMLDSSKPQLGAVSAEALLCYAHALAMDSAETVEPDTCRIHRAEVAVPIYRRFDVPDTALNRWLTARVGMFPNEAQPIDRNLYVFEFARGGRTLFTLVYHACHPVSRSDPGRMSPDYVGSVRTAVRTRFGARACLFLQGCAGDVRPNFARKRVDWLPRGRLNWRFEWPPVATSEAGADRAYADAVRSTTLWQSIELAKNSVRLERRQLPLRSGGPMVIPCLMIADRLRFEFLPFEVSHLFHLEAQREDPLRFLVSCADRTLGYLPHPRQLRAGGYEVDGSRECMGLPARVEIQPGVAAS
jgi:hypothetical protein